MYTFVSNVCSWSNIGGPQTRARNIESMLYRHAEFDFQIIKYNFDNYFANASDDIVHIQSNTQLVLKAIKRNLKLIVGPNMQWGQAPQRVWQYENMSYALAQRPDPAIHLGNPIWMNRIRYFPAFVDEMFWTPDNSKKTIDVLTIGKSFRYSGYYQNLVHLKSGLKKMKLKHLHLQNFTSQEYLQRLRQAKVLAYPSPKEAGASLANAIVEANMAGVPVIGLSSVLKDEHDEWHDSRGRIVQTIDEMLKCMPEFVDQYQIYEPRIWTLKSCSMNSGYRRLKALLSEMI